MNRAEAVRRGNIVFSGWDGEHKVGCYLGNGRFGAILSGLGLNLSPEQLKAPQCSPSHFNHMRHWGRFRFFSPHVNADSSADYILPLLRLYWAEEICGITDYRQCHDLYDGVLYTDFRQESGAAIHTETWFDAVNKDIAGVVIDADGAFPGDICLTIPLVVDPCAWVSGGNFPQSLSIERLEDGWRLVITCTASCNGNRTEVYISTNMDTEATDWGLSFHGKPGRNTLLMSVGTPLSGETSDGSISRTKEWWHKTWQETGFIEYPDEQMQQILLRGMAYLLSSYDAGCEMIPPSNSMGIGGFAYNFVPDVQYIAPPLLMLGHGEIVRHWVEHFAKEIDGLHRYAKQLWPDSDGIFPPWELNYGSVDGYHSPSVPLIFCYEAHNSGYLCRLAMEAAEFSQDEAWSKTYAHPLIRGCAEFFRSACYKGEDGLWHLHWYPCMGRDEAGGVNKEDYLCTLLTAKYSFQSAIKCGLDKDCDYRQILEDGLAFDSLLSERGTWHTCRGADDFGKQKHPIQLEGIACFPTEPAPLPAEKEAYKLRHEITEGAKRPFFWGWTLAQLLTAGTNMKDYDGWAYDWSLFRPSNYMDENGIQFYESSSMFLSPFYMSTHGMVMQSLIRNCVNDFWGRVEIGSCLPENISVSFENIRTRLGVSLSGQIGNGRFTGTVTAFRDCQVIIGNETFAMKQGESRTLALDCTA